MSVLKGAIRELNLERLKKKRGMIDRGWVSDGCVLSESERRKLLDQMVLLIADLMLGDKS